MRKSREQLVHQMHNSAWRNAMGALDSYTIPGFALHASQASRTNSENSPMESVDNEAQPSKQIVPTAFLFAR